MWSGDDSAFDGEHYRLERPLNSPAALSKPHPPILVGGGGEKKTLRMVAQYADACNIFDMGPDGVKAKFDVLHGHCEAVGRDYADIEKTVLSRVDLSQESVEQVADRFGALGAVGTEHVIIGLVGVDKEGAFEKVPDLVAAVNAL
jgi:alkanesulfonate monooxygenase SsuD/methylene tetrahydromethanopterin reductase-like flavin-dependent oxidoreductase (luciferase family)